MNIIVSLPQLTTVSQSSQDFKIPSNYECASILYDHPRAGQQVAHQKMPLGQEFWPFAWTDDKQLQPTTSEGCYIGRVSFSWKPDRMIFCVQWLILHENYLALLLRDPGIIDFIRLCGFQL